MAATFDIRQETDGADISSFRWKLDTQRMIGTDDHFAFRNARPGDNAARFLNI